MGHKRYYLNCLVDVVLNRVTYAFGHQNDMNRKDAKVAKNYYFWRS